VGRHTSMGTTPHSVCRSRGQQGAAPTSRKDSGSSPALVMRHRSPSVELLVELEGIQLWQGWWWWCGEAHGRPIRTRACCQTCSNLPNLQHSPAHSGMQPWPPCRPAQSLLPPLCPLISLHPSPAVTTAFLQAAPTPPAGSAATQAMTR
jgi:hypothetical protein